MEHVAEWRKTQNLQIQQLQNALLKYCLALTKSEWEADDLAQETWLKVWEKYRLQHANIEALLIRTARNLWIDLMRREQRWKRIWKEQLADPDQAITATIDPFEMESAFQILMEALTPLQCSVLLMRSVFGYSIAETAEWLNTTEGAVKAAYYRAQKELQKEQEKKQQMDQNKELLREPDIMQREKALPKTDMMEVNANTRKITEAFATGDVSKVLELVRQPVVHDELSKMYGKKVRSHGIIGSSASEFDIRAASRGMRMAA